MSWFSYKTNENCEELIDQTNLRHLEPEERITIIGKCYNVDNINKWVVSLSQDIPRLLQQYDFYIKKQKEPKWFGFSVCF